MLACALGAHAVPSANRAVTFDVAANVASDAAEFLSAQPPTALALHSKQAHFSVSHAERRQMQSADSTAITVSYTVLCDADCDDVSTAITTNAASTAQAWIDAINVMAASSGFSNVVISTAADVAASVTTPTTVSITLPVAPSPTPAPSGPTIAVSAGPYTAGVPVYVTFTGASSATDWIGVYADGAALDDYTDWVYHHGTQDAAGTLVSEGITEVVIPSAGSWFVAFLGDNGYIEIAPRINIDVGAAADPCGAGSAVDGATCGAGRAGDVCHGGSCEFITWARTENMQCQTFQADNTALRTLEAAQAACAASSTCGGVTDYWCNGMFGAEGADWYALCEGWMTIPHDSPTVCMWASPAPPPSTIDLCAGVTCTASSSCTVAGTCDPSTGVCGAETNVVDGSACDTGDGDATNDSCHAGVCESISWARTDGRQCATFLPGDPALNTLALAEAACTANPSCGGVTDLYCNGMFSASDYFGLCDGWETVDASDPATTGFPLCVFPRVGATQEIAWTIGTAYEPLLVTVGDILHFTWGGNHDVVIATDGTCDSVSSATAVLDSSGDFSVQVTAPGTTTYACSVGSHCSSGSQIITVNAVWPDVTPGTCSINDYEIQDVKEPAIRNLSSSNVVCSR